MRRTIAGSTRKHSHIDKLTLFASPDSKGLRDIWQCRASFGRDRSPVRSLQLEYIEGDSKNLIEAERKAADCFYKLEKDWRLGLPMKRLTVASAAKQYLREAKEGLEENVELDKTDEARARPRKLIPGGSSAWNKENYRQTAWVIDNLITCY